MEANEAPEKIYMTPSFGEPDNVLLAAFSKSHLEYHRDIEYIRTDAFINKACDWLKNNVEKYYYLDEAYDKVISIKNLNKDFKKYIEEL